MTDSDSHKSGLRKRIRKPAPPAPSSTARSATAHSAMRALEESPDLSLSPAQKAASDALDRSVAETTPGSTSSGIAPTPGKAQAEPSEKAHPRHKAASGSAGASGIAAGSVARGAASGVATGSTVSANGAHENPKHAGSAAGSAVATAEHPSTRAGANHRGSHNTEPPSADSTGICGDGESDVEKQSDASVVRSTGSMAVATLISRITGFFRNVLITATLGGAVASAFNVANTLPNLITEIVLGAVLTSLVVPVLVRAEKEDPDRGAAFIRRLLTVSLTLLGVVTVVVVIAAPILTAIMLKDDGKVNVPLTTSFAYLLLPQIIFYGIFSLLMAVLNTKGIFKPGAWAPVANNIIAIASLLLYWLLPGHIEADHPGTLLDPYILLLGLGTTLGVVVQAMIMVPYLRKAGIDMRPLWGIDDRIKQFSGMGIAIVAYVAISQLGYVITTKIASGAAAEAPTIYQQAWLLLQMPYGIIGVTLLTAIMPRLSRNAADGNNDEVVRDLSMGTRLTLIALIPVVAFFTAFGRPIAIGLFAYLNFPQDQANILGWTLSFSAFTLIPYAIVLLHLRVFYAREEAWTPTFIILGITIVKITLSLAAPLMAAQPHLVVVLLGAANGCGFIAGAVIGYVLLHRALGNLDTKAAIVTSVWALGASLVGVAVAWGVYVLTDIELVEAMGSIGFLFRTAIVGVVFLVVTGLVLSRSPLPEVKALGRMLERIPGLRRFAPKAESLDDAATTGASSFGGDGFSVAPPSIIGETTALANEGFTASPLLPPMPTQASRPIRFVPGEIVSGGRFRLRAKIAEFPGLRFWRATDQAAPEHGEVALVFIDTIALPAGTILPAQATTQIADHTRALRAVQGSGLPRIRSITHTRTDLLVVTDWKPSAALTSISTTPNPAAAALAVSNLAYAVGYAHEQNLLMGLDFKSERMRLTPEGLLFNAFPAVLPNASRNSDVEALCQALESLLATAPVVPRSIKDAIAKARANVADNSANAAMTLAEDLRTIAATPEDGADSPSPSITSDPETGPSVSVSETSTGYRQATGRSFRTGILVVAIVIVAAIIAAFAYGFLNRDSEAPLTGDSVSRGPAAARDAAKEAKEALVPRAVKLLDAAEWQASNPNPAAGPDNPDMAKLAIDGNPETGWKSSMYSEQFSPAPNGFKEGIGLVVTLEQQVIPTQVSVNASPGAQIEVRSLKSPDERELSATSLLGRSTAANGDTIIDLAADDGDPVGQKYLLIWVSKLPEQPNNGTLLPASINEVTVHGAESTK